MGRKKHNAGAMIEALEPRQMLTASAWLVKDLYTGTESGEPADFLRHDDSLYFDAGETVWRTDGSTAGTEPVINAGYTLLLGATRSHVYLQSFEPDVGSPSSVWIADGTEAGLRRIASVPASAGSMAVAAKGALFYDAPNPSGSGLALYKASPRLNEAVMLAEFPAQAADEVVSCEDIDAGGGVVYMMVGRRKVTRVDIDRWELWRTDGTRRGTSQLGAFDGPSGWMRLHRGKAYFAAEAAHGSGMWVSDGTVKGTRMLNLPGAAAAGIPSVIGGSIYFVADHANLGRTVWMTDGTRQGTRAIPITVGKHAADVVSTGVKLGQFIYYATDNNSTRDGELWRMSVVDGRAERVRRFGFLWGPFVHKGRLFVLADGELWQSDGTKASTVRLTQVCSGGDEGLSAAWTATIMNDVLYLPGHDAVHGEELWAVKLPVRK